VAESPEEPREDDRRIIHVRQSGGLTFGGARYGAGGLPTGANVGRITLAEAPSRAQRLYFVAADPLSSASLGLWQSDDHGATWQQKTLASAAGGADLFGADSSPDNQQGGLAHMTGDVFGKL